MKPKHRKAAKKTALTPAKVSRRLEASKHRISSEVVAVWRMINTCVTVGQLADRKSDRDRAKKCVDLCQLWLTEVQEQIAWHVRAQTLWTRNPSFVGNVCEEAVKAMGFLPSALKRLPSIDWGDPDTSECIGYKTLDVLAQVVRFVGADARQHPDRYKHWAQKYPYFPVMVFRNKSAYRQLFDELADELYLGLGECPIDARANARYHFHDELFVLVFDTVLEIWRILEELSWGDKTPSGETVTPEQILTLYAGVRAKDVPIFLAAHELIATRKRLYKSNESANLWANKIVIPYLCSKYPNWKNVPALCKESNYETKRSIARALYSFAKR